MVRGGESAMAPRKRRSARVDDDVVDLSDDDTVKPAGGLRNRDGVAAAPGARLGEPERGLNALQGFRRGNIVAVRMQRFVTFSDATILPTPRLNLIIGPNGSGKSTVVSAVCIALGGKLNLLGRSAELGQYVRHGSQSADVEVRIFDESARGGVRTVRRVFGGEEGLRNAGYYVDGRKAKASDVEAVKTRYDVQLDNLAQFMPQEKIAEFVNQNERDLLLRTVRALGGTAKAEKYDDLCSMDTKIVLGAAEVEKKEKSLNELVEKNRALEEEVRAFQELQQIKKEIKMCEKFIPHAKFAATQQEFGDLKSDTKKYEAVVAEKRQEAAALRGPLTHIEQRHKAAWKNFHDVERKKARTLDAKAVKAVTELDDLTGSIEGVYDELENNKKAVARKEREVEKFETRLAEERRKWEAACGVGSDAEAHEAIEALNSQRRALRQEKHEGERRKVAVDRDVRDLSRNIQLLQKRGNGLQDVRANRMRQLESRDRSGRLRGLSACAEWVRQNPGLFRGRVHGPVAVEVDCESDYYARILAHVVPEWVLPAFVTECKEDGDTLRREAQKATGFKVTTVSVPLVDGVWDVHRQQHPRRAVDDRLRSLGIERSVSQIYTAPDAVKAALHAQFNFHDMHVGTDQADQCMDQLACERDMWVWFTPRNVFSVRGSRYNQNSRSTSVTSLQGAGIFSERGDGAERERAEIQAQLQQEEGRLADAMDRRKMIVEETRNVDSRDRELLEESRSHQKAINGRAAQKKKVADLQRMLDTAKAGGLAKKLSQDAAALQRKLAAFEAESSHLANDVVSTLGASLLSMTKLDEALALFSVVDRELKAELRKHEDTNRELEELEKNLESLQENVASMRRRLKKERTEALKSVAPEDLETEPFFKTLSDEGLSVDDLEARIMSLRDKAGRMTNSGAGVVRQYEENHRKLEAIRSDLEEIRASHETHRITLETEKGEFTNWLVNVMNGMAAKFSELFQGLGCRGDIRLANSGSDRLAEMKIEILVSFRDDVDLRPVSQTSNSGGEKMATTMLYCFALQAQEENRNPPFVMIDELNQGLDPKNERYIMSLMMRQAESESMAQSFVVTPKLILQLPFGKNASSHVIMNGNVKLPVIAAGPS